MVLPELSIFARSEYAVSNDNVLDLKKPEVSSAVRDALSEGAHSLLAQAVEAEVTEFLARCQGEQDTWRARMVRNGHLPERASRASILSLVFKLTKSAEQRWLK